MEVFVALTKNLVLDKKGKALNEIKKYVDISRCWVQQSILKSTS